MIKSHNVDSKENGVWVDHPPAVVFEFSESRSVSHPLRYRQNCRGYLQADAYTGHGVLYETGNIFEVGYRAHCRRRFFEIAKARCKPGRAAQALRWIASLYAIESRIRDQTPDLKYAARQAQREHRIEVEIVVDA